MDEEKKQVWIKGVLLIGSFAFAAGVALLLLPYVDMIFDKLSFLQKGIVLIMLLSLLGYMILKEAD